MAAFALRTLYLSLTTFKGLLLSFISEITPEPRVVVSLWSITWVRVSFQITPSRPMGRSVLGSGPHVVGRLGSGPRVG